MKICFITKDYRSELDYGGLATYVHNTAHDLVNKGHEVHIITESHKNKDYIKDGVFVHTIKANYFWYEDFEIKGNLKIKSLPRDLSKIFIEKFLIRTMTALMFNIPVYKRFNKLYKKHKFDIVECEDGGGIGVPLSYIKNIILVTKLHTSWTLSSYLNKETNPSGFIDRLIIKILEKIQLIRSQAITSNSNALKKKTCQLYNIPSSKVRVIHCSMGIKEVLRLAHNPRRNHIINKIKKSVLNYLLFIGRIETRKGLDTLANALPDIFNYNKDIKMVFAGRIFSKHIYHNIIKKLTLFKNRVIFLDHIPHEDLMPIIKGAKIVILPSYWEAFGYTCLESMALGKIVIASSGSGFEEQIQKDGKGGFLFRPRDSNELAKKIIKILKMPKKKLNTISKNARKRAMDFDNSKITPKLIDYYKTIIKNHKKTK